MKTQYTHPAFPALNFNWIHRIVTRLFLVALLFGASAQAHPIVQSWQNRTGSVNGFTIQPRFTLLNTDSNFDSFGQSTALGNNNSTQRYYFDLNASFGFTENLFVYGRLSALYSTISGTGINDQGNFGLSDQLVGTSYRLYQSESGMSFSIQGEATLPAYDNNVAKASGNPYLGDGSLDMTFGGFVEIPISHEDTYEIYLDGGAGYTYRSKGFSAGIPWNIQLKSYPNMEGFLFAVGARGNISLQTDTTFTNDSAIGAGGSYLIHAINPEWIHAQASLGYQASNNLQYLISGAIPIYGKNSPNAMQISFGFQFEFGQRSIHDSKPARKLVNPNSFRQYDIEAKITSSNDQLYLLKIDKGTESGIEKGQIFDIFVGEDLVAKAKVMNVKNEFSALRVLEYFKEQSIEVDSIARRVIEQR